MTYIENSKKEEGCVFCNAQAKPDGTENLIAFRGRSSYVILNRFPYTSGHLMVIPFAHAAGIEELDANTRAEMMELTSRCTTELRQIYKPQGFNVGINMGDASGASIEHLHQHVVPRYPKEMGFLDVISGEKIIIEDPVVTMKKLRIALEEALNV
jgi:ATP adenylyltransferase